MSQRPLPVPTPTSRPFWDGLRERRIRLQFCGRCERWVHYPRSNCPHCLEGDLEWREVGGQGSVYTFTIARTPTAPAFADEAPQRLAVIELDEGPRLTSTLTGVEPDAIRVGMRVKPRFEDVEDPDGTPVTLLRYEPA